MPQTPSTQLAPQIIGYLEKEATSILGKIVKAPLQDFTVGQKGMFPYYWQNPSNLEFNHVTYDWINSNLKAKATPKEFEGSFTNIYIQALSAVSYSLSTHDQAALNQAHQNATNQQAALLSAWKQAFGSLPKGTSSPPQQPIDVIMSTIANDWASKPTTLAAIQKAPNLNALLDKTPASGQPVLPVLANYLNALGASISLQNATTMNNGYLARALAAVQTPTADNGGLMTDDNKVRPRYQVSTQLASILNGLKDKSNTIKLDMSVTRSSSSQYQVSVQGGVAFTIPVPDLMTVNVGGSAGYFEGHVATSSNSVDVSMTFDGVTFVSFGPTDFDASSGLNWYWMFPIQHAIANGSKDVTGFKFSPNPQIDFSDSGPFGFLNGVAMSNYPSLVITVKGSNYQSIATQFQQSASVGISFLGIPLGLGGKEASYSSSVQTDASSQEVTIRLSAPPDLVAGNSVDSVGWILGVQTDYPAA